MWSWRTNLLTQKNLHQFPHESQSSNLSGNTNKRCQPEWGSWRRRRREGSQRKKGELRREETHKGKEGRAKGFTAEKSRRHSRGSGCTENESGDWKVWVEVLTLNTSLDLFFFIEMFSSQGPNSKYLKETLLKMKLRALESCTQHFFSCEPSMGWHFNLSPFYYVLGKLGTKPGWNKPLLLNSATLNISYSLECSSEPDPTRSLLSSPRPNRPLV